MRAEEILVQIKSSAHTNFAEFARNNVKRSAPNLQANSFEGWLTTEVYQVSPTILVVVETSFSQPAAKGH